MTKKSATPASPKKKTKVAPIAKMSPVESAKPKKHVAQVRYASRGPLYGTIKKLVRGRYDARVHADAIGILESMAESFLTRAVTEASASLRSNPTRKTLSRKDMRYAAVKLLDRAHPELLPEVLGAESAAVTRYQESTTSK